MMPHEKRPISCWAFLLAHHWSEDVDRCWRMKLRGRDIFLCARCTGLYPTMLAVMAWQLAAPLRCGWYDWLWLFVPAIPALLDWGRFRLARTRGSNRWRTFTGALLGLALGRALYLHMRRPFHAPAAALFGLLALTVLVVELVRWRRMVIQEGGKQ